MKVAIYARVSTFDKGQDPETQLMPMREYCQKSHWDYAEFVDQASGVNGKRPALDDMMVRLKKKEFDILMVWKLDRLGRSLQHLIGIVYGELHPRGINFISFTQGIDTTTPGGTLLFNIFGSFAQFEHDLIAERVRAGMARAKAQGHRVGRVRAKVDIKRLLSAYQDSKGIRAAVRIYNKGLTEKKWTNPGTAFARLKEAGILNNEETQNE